VNSQDDGGETAFHVTVQRGAVIIAKYLLETGASIEIEGVSVPKRPVRSRPAAKKSRPPRKSLQIGRPAAKTKPTGWPPRKSLQARPSFKSRR